MRGLIIIIIGLVLLGAGVYLWYQRGQSNPANLSFAPYQNGYETKVDFARIEHEFPLKREDLARLTIDNIEAYNQEELDQIYARITAGPIPDGPYSGKILLPRGSSGRLRASEIVGGLKGLGISIGGAKLTALGEALWKGKVFYRDERVLRNRIDHLDLLENFFPDRRGEVRQLKINGGTEQLLFPAKLYCGQSMLDSRRESVIIDYAFTDELPGYREVPDALAGRDGFLIRDEIRMIRPGFYLGRAYMNAVFALNFALFNADVANASTEAWQQSGKIAEDCWTGPPSLAQASAR
jgi:hypothetical protein